MQYLDNFILASQREEDSFILSVSEPKMNMTCYADSPYPFGIFPKKQLQSLDFSGITLIYGGNGSGKSTLLNIIAMKLGIRRDAPFNETPFFEEYLHFCKEKLTFGRKVPEESRMIASDDIFDFLLDLRSLNQGVDDRRDKLFEEYLRTKKEDQNNPFVLRSLEDYEELKRHNEIRKKTMSSFTSRRIPGNIATKSNGESAFGYFTRAIGENALYLLDEPENSLSAKLQQELAKFLTDSVRFYHCQFIISTHSPFLLAMPDVTIYDLDSIPVREKRWTELENVRLWHDFFESHRSEFQKKENGAESLD